MPVDDYDDGRVVAGKPTLASRLRARPRCARTATRRAQKGPPPPPAFSGPARLLPQRALWPRSLAGARPPAAGWRGKVCVAGSRALSALVRPRPRPLLLFPPGRPQIGPRSAPAAMRCDA
eukprot:scaffold95_cov476-Prasinococcus_capsulatus_cf.AAC.6